MRRKRSAGLFLQSLVIHMITAAYGPMLGEGFVLEKSVKIKNKLVYYETKLETSRVCCNLCALYRNY